MLAQGTGRATAPPSRQAAAAAATAAAAAVEPAVRRSRSPAASTVTAAAVAPVAMAAVAAATAVAAGAVAAAAAATATSAASQVGGGCKALYGGLRCCRVGLCRLQQLGPRCHKVTRSHYWLKHSMPCRRPRVIRPLTGHWASQCPTGR